MTPALLALDFDGVICNGLREYFQTARKAYCEVWQPTHPQPPVELADVFYRLRPVVESGWEMPLLLRALMLGESEQVILQSWSTISQKLLQTEHLTSQVLTRAVDGVRDRWIAADLAGWLAEHAFYPGVIERLQQILDQGTPVWIISTKEGRFIQQLLLQQGLRLQGLTILGKEVKRPKHQTLRELAASYPDPPDIWFVEDRFKTLLGVQQQPDLPFVTLFLADWGYNTAAERVAAQHHPGIQLISLTQFAADFPIWTA